MPNCNFNCCRRGSYYPREVFTCNCLNNCNAGTIINPQPTIERAVLGITAETMVSGNSVVPVSSLFSNGTAVRSSGNGNISLTAGVYQVSYNITGIVPNGGFISTALMLDGTQIQTTNSVVSAAPGTIQSVSNQIILNLTQNQILALFNETPESVNVISANISLLKL